MLDELNNTVEQLMLAGKELVKEKRMSEQKHTKGRVMRYRPMFRDWKLTFDVEFEDEISAEVMKEAFEIAGRYVGIGDWRPQKKGKFGKFQVTNFQEN